MKKAISRLLAVVFGLFVGSGIAPQAQADTFDIDFIRCGELACAYAYQGEGVNHPQLVVHMYPKTGGLQANDFTYIIDQGPAGAWSFRLYFNNTMIEYFGPGETLFIPPQLYQEAILEDGIVLAEGLEVAFTAPETYFLGWWPTPQVIQELVEQSYDLVPQSIKEWDAQNGNPPNGFDPQEGGGGMGGQAVGGLMAPDTCPNAPGCPPPWDVDTPRPVQSFAAEGAERRHGAAIQARFAATLARDTGPASATVNRLRARQNPAAAGSNCTMLGLSNALATDGLNGCYEKCDVCSELDASEFQVNATEYCAEFAIGAAVLTVLLTEGAGAVGFSAIMAGGTATCTTVALSGLSGFKATRRDACRRTCDKLNDLAQ